MTARDTAPAPLLLTPAELPARVGHHLGYSPWHRVEQRDIDLFAEATGDHQWIHVDPVRAAAGPFGACIAHGFLTLSLLAPLVSQVFEVAGAEQAVNARVDKVRFRTPVPAGSSLRAGVTMLSARPRPRAFLEVVIAVSIELEGGRVACSAEQTTLYPGLG